VFVNYGGAGYWWLDHSAWNGLTVADVVFACFVFTMGASMALSLRSQRRRGATSCEMSQRMAWRALKLLLVGLFLNNGLVLEQWRFLGVLQYFAVAALCVALIDIWVPKLALASPSQSSRRDASSAYTGTGAAVSGSGLRERSVNSGAGGFGGSTDIFEEAAVEYHDSSVKAAAPLRGGRGGGEYEMLTADTAAAHAFHSRHASSSESAWCSSVCVAVWGDVTPYLMEWLVIASLEAVYLCVQFFLPVPGCPTGYLGPGGLAEDGKFFNCPGGAHGYIDRLVWGAAHMYHNQDANGAIVSAATCADSFRCPVYDPEGTLGAINAVVIAFLGLQAGRIMLAHKTPKRDAGADDDEEPQWSCGSGLTGVALRWLVWGVACGLIAGALCGFSQNEGVIPVTKNLWSPSYILGMAGASFFMLAVLLMVVDLARLWDGAPFTFIGKNSIAVYCISEIFQMFAPFTIVVNAAPAFAIDQEFRSHTQAAVANFVGVSCIALVALWFARNKIFIKL
jgi:heparan-alpha-glucosaminide N-acetyltransferase